MRFLWAFILIGSAHAQFPSPPTGLQIWTNPNVGPTANSVVNATATATNNALCTAIRPFYWEIGNGTKTLVFGSVGTPTEQPTALHSIASASKWVYSTYVAEVRGGTLTTGNTGDIGFLSFISGYANMGNGTGGGASATCPNTLSPRTINKCLTQPGYTTQLAPSIGNFDYDAGHMENHAGTLTALGNVGLGSLFSTMNATLGTTSGFIYSQPTPAEGLYGTANDYTVILRAIISGLQMKALLGTSAVCTTVGGGCGAIFTPIAEAWHYSIGHWVEDDPATAGDGAFSSPGAFGFYPWIDASKTYYGVVSRQAATGGQGLVSAKCGRLIRHAWITGVEQTHTIPDQP